MEHVFIKDVLIETRIDPAENVDRDPAKIRPPVVK